MSINLTELAQQVYEELGSPDSPTAGFLLSILRFKIGELNNLIDTGYGVNAQSGEVEPDLGLAEANILKNIYLLHYYDEKVRNVLASTDTNSLIEISENGATIRRASPTEIVRYWNTQRKDHKSHLDELVAKYRINQAVPLQVAGTDSTAGMFDVDNIISTDE